MATLSERYAVLVNAEKFVEVYGDPSWFKEHYTVLRAENNIIDSVEGALRSQGLWNPFLTLFYPHLAINSI